MPVCLIKTGVTLGITTHPLAEPRFGFLEASIKSWFTSLEDSKEKVEI